MGIYLIFFFSLPSFFFLPNKYYNSNSWTRSLHFFFLFLFVSTSQYLFFPRLKLEKKPHHSFVSVQTTRQTDALTENFVHPAGDKRFVFFLQMYKRKAPRKMEQVVKTSRFSLIFFAFCIFFAKYIIVGSG